MYHNAKVWALCTALLLGGVQMGCKSTDKTTASTSKNKTTTPEAEPESKGNASLSGLGALGGTTTTDKAQEQESGMKAELPFSPNFRTGTLDNGMRYYIRKNSKPENRIELRLAVDAGAMQEDDDQRGLAHFVEHMAFNGTTNFEKNELVSFLEQTGVRFGADLNAYTSFDETVYMLQLPTDKEGLVDKGLLVMSDWATGVAFEGEEIDKERGVIQSEWRTGLGASERMRQVWWPKVFYNTRYADRLPIGLMEVIQNAPHERFRQFYKDWYRPNLQAIVVVGDLDVEEMEQKIKDKFSGLKNPENPREKVEYEVPGHEETFVAIATDPEATSVDLQLYTKLPAQKIKNLSDYRTSLLHALYNGLMNDRFEELAREPDAPFLNAYSGYGGFVRTKDAFFSGAQAKETGILATLRLLLRENQRVLQHGFTEAELERQKLNVETEVENQYKERDKIESDRLARQAVAHFLKDEPLFGASKERELVKEFLPTITLEEVNALAKGWMIEENRALIVTAPEKASVKLPTEAELRQVLAEAKDLTVEPYKDKFSDLPLLETLPEKGSVVSTQTITEDGLNITEYTLSNGIKVVLKPTPFQNDKIYLVASSPGGHSLYSDADFMTAQNAAGLVDEMGVGAFDALALNRKLTGQTLSIQPYINELYEGFVGNTSVEDAETFFQLIYLYATAPRKSQEDFDRTIDQTKEQLRNLSANPRVFLRKEIARIKYGDHPRRMAIPTEEDMDRIDLDRAMEIYNDRFDDFSDFTFVLVGSFQPEDLKPHIEQYLGALPSINRKEKGKDVGVTYRTEGVNASFKKGLAPQATVYINFVQETPLTPAKELEVDAMGQILNIMVRENLREEKGGVYSPYVGANTETEPRTLTDVVVFFQCAPEDVDELVEAVKEEIQDLQQNGPTQENYDKIRETLRRARESDLEKNRFWVNTLSRYYRKDKDLSGIKNYDNLVENLTREDIKRAVNRYVDWDKAVIVTVKPEKETSEKP